MLRRKNERLDKSPYFKSSQKQRSITQTAIKLTFATALLFLLVLTYVAIFESQPPEESSTHSQSRFLEEDNYQYQNCEDIYEYTSPDNMADRCLFAQSCNNNDGFPFSSFVFCSSIFSTNQLLILCSVPLFIMLVTLFRMLGSTAEDYFSPSLEMFSKKLGLPPRFAGVTLLALGNGAADVSSTISAVTSNPSTGYKLTLGSLTGCGMFTGTVVAGFITVIADSVKFRGALIRDVSALAITMMVVFLEFRSGSIGRGSTTLFFSMYFFFIAVVLAADIYHRTVHLPKITAHMEKDSKEKEHRNEDVSRSDIEDFTNEQSNGQDFSTDSYSIPDNRVDKFVTAFSNYDNDEDLDNRTGTEAEAGDFFDTADNKSDEIYHDNGNFPYHAMEEFSEIDHSLSLITILIKNYDDLKIHWNEYVSNNFRNDEIHPLDNFFLVIEFPFTLARKMSVPVPTNDYYCRPVVALSCIFSPLWFATYFMALQKTNIFEKIYLPCSLTLIAIMSLVGLLVATLAPPGKVPMKLIYATPIALYGFLTAALWIDFFAFYLVELLEFFGILFRIPSSILGITLLSWGNSMGDLSANTTMAKKGLANMAITACFASPIFNILIGFGSAFSVLRSIEDEDTIEVELSPSITVGFMFLILNSVAILVTGIFICKGKIPKTYGYFSLALYLVYIVTSITVQIFESDA